jgi:hypothetical protein
MLKNNIQSSMQCYRCDEGNPRKEGELASQGSLGEVVLACSSKDE